MKDESSLFVKRLFAFSFGPIMSSIIGFLIVPLTTRLFSPEDFGKASMYTLTVSAVSLFVYLGIDQAFSREYNAEKNKQELLWNSFIIPFFFSLILSLVILLFSQEVSAVLFGSYEQFIIVLIMVTIPIKVIHRFNTLIIRMQEKARLYSTIMIAHRLLNTLFLLGLVIYYENSFKVIVFAQFLSEIAITLIISIFNLSTWRYKFKINKRLMVKLIKFGLPIVPASIFGWLLHSMDKIALRSFSDFNELGIYAAAFKIVMIIEILKTGFKNFWMPTAYRWYETKVQNYKFENVSRLLMTFLVLVFSAIVLFKDLISLILGSEYRTASVVVPFLLFYPMMDMLVTTTNLGITFSRKTFYKIPIFATVSALNLFGNYLLVPTLGALGAAISTGISFIFFFIIQSTVSRKLWYCFEMKFYYINLTFMVILSSVSVIFKNTVFEIILVFMLLLYNKEHIIQLLKYSKKALSKANK